MILNRNRRNFGERVHWFYSTWTLQTDPKPKNLSRFLVENVCAYAPCLLPFRFAPYANLKRPSGGPRRGHLPEPHKPTERNEQHVSPCRFLLVLSGKAGKDRSSQKPLTTATKERKAVGRGYARLSVFLRPATVAGCVPR